MEEIKMNSISIKLNIAIFLGFVFLTFGVFAQPPVENGDYIIIQGSGLRKVDPAYRINSTPTVVDTNMAATLPEFPLLSPFYLASASINPIKEIPYNGRGARREILTPFYAKVGIGSSIMPLGELYFNSIGKNDWQYGIYAKHISNFGRLKEYAPSQFDRTNAGAFGAYYAKKFTIGSSFNYMNYGFNYYGLRDSMGTINDDSIAQRFQNISGELNINWHNGRKDTSTLNFNVGIKYNHFGTSKPFEDSLSDWKTRENYVAMNSRGFYKVGREKFYVDLNVLNNQFQYGIPGDTIHTIDTGYVYNDLIIQLKPGVVTQMMNDKLRIEVGVDVTANIRNSTKFYLYPRAEIKYSMFDDIFIPYIGIKGGLQQNTLRSLTAVNEFLLPNANLQNENKVFDTYAGFKGVLSRRMSFNIGANYARINNKALFVNDTLYSSMNKFSLIYDSLNIMSVEGSLSYQINEKLKLDGIGRFYSYETKNQAYAWNLPQLQFMIRGNYVLKEKFIFNLDMSIETGRKSLVYDSTIAGVVYENNQYAAPLKTFLDMNLSFEYKYNKMISGFIQFNNLVSQRYLRWYNYPVQGFQIMGGATFKF
jgi:hypothetical protein